MSDRRWEKLADIFWHRTRNEVWQVVGFAPGCRPVPIFVVLHGSNPTDPKGAHLKQPKKGFVVWARERDNLDLIAAGTPKMKAAVRETYVDMELE